MVPVSLSVHNFLSYGDQVPPLDFTRFHVACLCGGNGHGKSALLDALTYALWGEARKSRHERKPDEGLLRLGASEMRVELCFDLDADRFRVARSFRRGRRSGSSQLELQILDRGAGRFRSLSEGASLGKTQERIEHLLCMDYDTFINSAFLVQGRADEFTQKGALQRKEILADILGLGRYDRLQELARFHWQQHSQQRRECERRLAELDAHLEHRDEYERQLEELRRELDECAAVLEESGKELERLRGKGLEYTQLQRRCEEMERERTHLGGEVQRREKEREHLRTQQQKDDHILGVAAAIERDFETYQQLIAAETLLAQKMPQHRALEAEAGRLEAAVARERHKVEARRQKWETHCQSLNRQLRQWRATLDQEQRICARRELFLAARHQARELEAQRLRYEALQREKLQLHNAVELEKRSLATRREDMQSRIEELGAQLGRQRELEQRIERLCAEVEMQRREAVRRERLVEEGSALHTRIEQARQQLEALEERRGQAREKLLILRGAEEAECPLCGSKLDAAHRRQLEAELARQEEERGARAAREGRELEELERELEARRRQYQHAERQSHVLQAQQKELAGLQERRAQLLREAELRRQLEAELAALDRILAGEAYAREAREKLRRTSAELESLAYRPAAHDELAETLAELSSVESEYRLLEEARAQEKTLRRELDAAGEKLALAQNYLDEALYARREQDALEETHRRLAELDYSPEAHQQLRSRRDEISDAVARRERLIAARQRFTSTQQSLEQYARELETLRQRLEALAREQAELSGSLEALRGVEERFEALGREMNRARSERDQLLQRQGALQTQCERCAAMAVEREELAGKLKTAQDEARIYEQLVEALGKDGIQALIIESAIPEIEDEANAILARLSDNRIQVAIESLRDLKKGGTRETLDIKIADEIGERSYHLYSGGEAFRTNFALRIALSRVLARRAGTRLRTLIVDEGFGTQDQQGLEQLVEAIHEISKDFDKVLVVTHLAELKKSFPVQIEVTKDPDLGSRFEIVHNA